MEKRFKVIFLQDAKDFLDNLDEKTRDKIYYNIWKSTQINDNSLFKKLQDEIWEFRTLYNKNYYRLLAFWDKENKDNTIVISTHGFIKKTDKTPKSELEMVEKLRKKYFKEKK